MTPEHSKTESATPGVVIDNILCTNDHGDSGQIMEAHRLGGYVCPECGRQANLRIEWEDGDD